MIHQRLQNFCNPKKDRIRNRHPCINQPTNKPLSLSKTLLLLKETPGHPDQRFLTSSMMGRIQQLPGLPKFQELAVTLVHEPLKVTTVDRSEAQEWWVFRKKSRVCLENRTGQLKLQPVSRPGMPTLQHCIRQGSWCRRAKGACRTDSAPPSPPSSIRVPCGSTGAKDADFFFHYLNPLPYSPCDLITCAPAQTVLQQSAETG